MIGPSRVTERFLVWDCRTNMLENGIGKCSENDRAKPCNRAVFSMGLSQNSDVPVSCTRTCSLRLRATLNNAGSNVRAVSAGGAVSHAPAQQSCWRDRCRRPLIDADGSRTGADGKIVRRAFPDEDGRNSGPNCGFGRLFGPESELWG